MAATEADLSIYETGKQSLFRAIGHLPEEAFNLGRFALGDLLAKVTTEPSDLLEDRVWCFGGRFSAHASAAIRVTSITTTSGFGDWEPFTVRPDWIT